MEYSKKELAAKFGVTTQALDKRINKLGLREKCVKDESNRLWIPGEIAEILANSYEKRFQEVETSFKPDETDWKAMYLAEKERKDELSRELIALTKSNQELNERIIQLLGNERLLDQAERARELMGSASSPGHSGRDAIDAVAFPAEGDPGEPEPMLAMSEVDAAVSEAVEGERERLRGMSLFDRIFRWHV